MSKEKVIKVLIIDDSTVVQMILKKVLYGYPEIEVVGTAKDPFEARKKIMELKPDVLTLDIAMPKMDGLTFLKITQKYCPIPTIILSSISNQGSNIAFQAMENGAIDVLVKPTDLASIESIKHDLIEKIKAASIATAPAFKNPSKSPFSNNSANDTTFDSKKILLLGASTGGVNALNKLLIKLPKNIPGICIIQHIPAHFSARMAERLNEICNIEVREARDGDIIRPGLALLAPGDHHMTIAKQGNKYIVKLSRGKKILGQRPSVDTLFKSAAKVAGSNAVAAILTGMGEDGGRGLMELRNAGARTFAQSEASCVVYGMPKYACKIGAVEKTVDLANMHIYIEHALRAEVPIRA